MMMSEEKPEKVLTELMGSLLCLDARLPVVWQLQQAATIIIFRRHFVERRFLGEPLRPLSFVFFCAEHLAQGSGKWMA
jgi:hypothetical protein